MDKSRELVRQQLKKLLRSPNELEQTENTWAEQNVAPSFHHLHELHLQHKTLSEEYTRKELEIAVVNERLKLIKELTEYLRDYLLPMSSQPPSFSFDSYIPPISLYKRYGDMKIAEVDSRLRPLLEAWEKQHNQPLIVFENRYLDSMYDNHWATVDPSEVASSPGKKSATPSKQLPAVGGSSKNLGTSAKKPVSTPTKKVETPVRKGSTPGGRMAAPPSPARAPATPVKKELNLGSTTPRKLENVPKILLHRDVPYSRPVKDKALFDPNDKTNGKRSYLIEQQEDHGPDQYIKVTARIRPLQPHETNRGDKYVVSVDSDQTTIILDRAAKNKSTTSFQLTSACPVGTSQLEFYNRCNIKPLLERALNGDYVTAFAYGQTGSGKTYSIAGPEEVIMLHEGIRITDPDGLLPESVKQVLSEVLQYQLLQHGVMPRSARYLFDKIVEAETSDENLQYEVRCSYVEIYNENLVDLLNPDNGNLEIKLNNGEREGFHVEGITERIALTTDDVMSIFMEGAKNRKVSSHLLNVESSRSHALFVMTIDQKKYTAADNTLWIRRGKVTFVDLAGSESVKTTQTSGSGLRETAGINTSLLNLSNIVASIAKDGLSQTAHVPWRNSKLTMLLMESLANNGSTIMIACVSPSNEYLSETSNTLTFATKASNIVRHEVRKVTDAEKETDALRADVIKLRKQLDKLEAENARLEGLLKGAGIPF